MTRNSNGDLVAYEQASDVFEYTLDRINQARRTFYRADRDIRILQRLGVQYGERDACARMAEAILTDAMRANY